ATANLQTPADFSNVILQDRVRLGDVAPWIDPEMSVWRQPQDAAAQWLD
ncbi:hypothetical protein HFO12_27875, partial [Rhizobium leguminosarum]|nr:hypothetical protein [Rhizobium leguminosarum]